MAERPQPPASMPVWPWLVAPALMLLLIVGFSALGLLLVNRGRATAEPAAVVDDPPSIGAPHGTPTETPHPAPRDESPAERPATLPDPPPAPAVAPLFATRRPQPAPDLEVAASAPNNAGRSVTALPKLSEALLPTPAPDAASKEVPKPTPEREALYDAVVQRFVLYDLGRLRGVAGRKAALDFEALGPDAILALVRGLNRSATLDASCPVVSISNKLAALLADCNDLELIARVRDEIGKGVTLTPYSAYLDALRQSCAARLKKAQNLLKPQVPHLVAELKAKGPAVRRKAANALGLAGADAKPAVPALIDALKDPDAEVRATAARALAAIGAPAVPALVKAAESSPDRSVRSLAYLALGESRPIDPEASRALIAALKDPDKEIRAAAAFALAGLGEGAVPPLRQALRAKDASAALALGLIGPPAANPAIPELVAAMSDDDRELRVAAHHAVVMIGAPAVQALATALSRADLRGWYSITVALGKIGPAAKPAAVPALTAGLTHDDKGVRILAANALAKIDPDNPAIKPVLVEAVPVLIEVLQHCDGALRAWAAVSLGRIGPDARSAGPALTVALTDADATVRAAAADALGRIGPRDHAAVFALVTAQRDADETVRTAARDALTRLGKSAVPILVGALDEPDREVRCGAARALGVIHAKDAAAAESLLKHLYDADADFRTACREGLVGIGPGSVGPLSGALKAGDAPTRIAAAEVLKKLGPRAQEALPALVAAAKDADSQVRTAALAALRDVVTVPADGKLDPAGESALQAFTVGLRDADGEVRIAAHLGMIRLGRAAAPALATALGDKDAPVRRLATETLQKLGPDARLAVPELIAALRDADAEVRDGAGWALEALDPELRAALPALRAALAAPPKPMPIAVVAKEFCYRTVAELAALAAGQPGDLSRQALQELSLRRGEEALTALALAAVSDDRDTRALGREMLLKCLDKRPDDKAEDAAARRLKLARRLLEEGKTDAAHEDIRTLIQSQPRTRAAEEGRRLLAEAKPQE